MDTYNKPEDTAAWMYKLNKERFAILATVFPTSLRLLSAVTYRPIMLGAIYVTRIGYYNVTVSIVKAVWNDPNTFICTCLKYGETYWVSEAKLMITSGGLDMRTRDLCHWPMR